jgi:mRNA-degrading endonuclease RelE of RelBE toxin-antitoxin system
VIASLAHDPHPPHSRKVVGTDLYRIRVRVDGVPWRVVYTISDTDQLVVVTRVVRRDEATYRGL